jgi:hypothetical protein
MQKNSSDSKGFAHIVTLVLIVILLGVAGGGVYVYHRNHGEKKHAANNSTGTTNNQNKNSSSKSTTTKPDPYAGWKTATLSSPQLRFRYPADWTVVTGANGKNIEVKSPVSNGHYFDVSLIAGKPSDVNLSFLGSAPGTTVANFTVDNRMLYAVAQTSGTNGAITGIGLATTAGTANTSFGILDSQKVNDITMVASLTPVTSTASDTGAEYSMDTYTAHSSYQDVLKVFRSLTGALPQ